MHVCICMRACVYAWMANENTTCVYIHIWKKEPFTYVCSADKEQLMYAFVYVYMYEWYI